MRCNCSRNMIVENNINERVKFRWCEIIVLRIVSLLFILFIVIPLIVILFKVILFKLILFIVIIYIVISIYHYVPTLFNQVGLRHLYNTIV